MKFLKLLFLSLIITSCAPVYVIHDFEKDTDFSKYKTYNYYSNLDTGLSGLDTKRLLSVLDKALALRGFIKKENPDFYININSQEYEEQQNNTIGIGVGGGGRHIGGGVSVGIPIGQTKRTRQIVFDFIDDKGIGLFWQAMSESNFNPNASPDKREARLNKIVEKVLGFYPPEKK